MLFWLIFGFYMFKYKELFYSCYLSIKTGIKKFSKFAVAEFAKVAVSNHCVAYKPLST